MNGQIHSMQESIARLESSHAEIGEQQKMLKQEGTTAGAHCSNQLCSYYILQPCCLCLCHQKLPLWWLQDMAQEGGDSTDTEDTH